MRHNLKQILEASGIEEIRFSDYQLEKLGFSSRRDFTMFLEGTLKRDISKPQKGVIEDFVKKTFNTDLSVFPENDRKKALSQKFGLSQKISA